MSNNSISDPKLQDKVDLFPIFKTMYDLALDFEHAHGQFPKIHKFTVGDLDPDFSTICFVSLAA